MATRIARRLVLLFSLLSINACVHHVPASNVLLDIGAYSIAVEIQLPLSELGAAMRLPLDNESTQTITQHGEEIRAYIDRHVDITTTDGTPYKKDAALLESAHIKDGNWIVAHIVFTPPLDISTRTFVLNYDVIVADVIAHNVSVRRDFRNILVGDDTVMIGLMHSQQKQLTVNDTNGSRVRRAR